MEKITVQPQPLNLPILNFDNAFEKKFKKHSDLFGGKCKRGLLVGPSGSGKTNAMLSLLLAPNGLRFLNLYVCSNSLNQEKYMLLRRIMNNLDNCGYYEFSNIDDLIPPTQIKEYSVIIFDDIPSTGHHIVKDYFSYGRHRNVDCFYLCQSYSAIPKQLIRDNSNYIVLWRQDLMNARHVYNDFLLGDMTFDKFQDICRICWNKTNDILVIDLDCDKANGRYRQGFDKFITL